MKRHICGMGAAVGLLVVGVGLAGESRSPVGRAEKSSLGYRGSLLVQLRVADLDRAIAFYRDVLDFDVTLRSDELQWAELSFGLDGVEIGVGSGAEVKGSGSVSLNIGVKDITAAKTVLDKRGVVFKSDVITIPEKVRLLDFADPDGNRIRFAESLTDKP